MPDDRALSPPRTEAPLPWCGIPPVWAALVAAYYVLLASGGGFRLFDPVPHGLTFNSMAVNLLQGRFDVDPEAIGMEAFVHGGQTYAYFGIFPALLRLPLLPFIDPATTDLTRISVAVALVIGALASARAVAVALRSSVAGPFRDAVRDRLVLAMLLSGPPILLALQIAIYEEAITWAWAMASIFVATALRCLTGSGGFTAGALSTMAVAAGVCLLTRPSTALGLHVSLALIMLWLLLRADGDAGPPWRRFLRCLPTARIVVPTLIVLVFVTAAGTVNWGRWGNPFVVQDMRTNVHFLEAYPERLARLDRYGMFNIQRVPHNFAYYVLPLWMLPAAGDSPHRARALELFDTIELPAGSLIISDPLTVTLAVAGAAALLRGPAMLVPRLGAAALIAGLSISPLLMFMAWAATFRYRAEFAPLLTALACIGAASWIARAGGWTDRRRSMVLAAVIVLFVVQVLASQLFGLTNALLPRGIGVHHFTASLADVYRLCLTTGCPAPPD